MDGQKVRTHISSALAPPGGRSRCLRALPTFEIAVWGRTPGLGLLQAPIQVSHSSARAIVFLCRKETNEAATCTCQIISSRDDRVLDADSFVNFDRLQVQHGNALVPPIPGIPGREPHPCTAAQRAPPSSIFTPTAHTTTQEEPYIPHPPPADFPSFPLPRVFLRHLPPAGGRRIRDAPAALLLTRAPEPQHGSRPE